MNALVLKELELRQEQRTVSAVSARALPLGREVRLLQERADDYAALLRVAEGMS